jgi:mannosidase alpha-like ER degradation enhancer 1
MNEKQKFHSSVKKLIRNLKSFEIDSRIQVFEVTIRVLGGLLSSHLLLLDKELGFEMSGYKGELLSLAKDLADRLMPAFTKSNSGIPWARVSFIYPDSS